MLNLTLEIFLKLLAPNIKTGFMKQAIFFTVLFLCAQFLIGQDTLHGIKISRHPQAPNPPTMIIQSEKTNFSLGIGGFVKLIGVYDPGNGMTDHLDFITYDIAVPGLSHQRDVFILDASQSRIHTELLGKTKLGDLRIYLEADFGGLQGSLRLRQAYGSIGGFLIGQTWSTFMDLDAGPNTIDGEGPNAEIALRTAMIRYTCPLSKKLQFAVAIESPSASVTIDKHPENEPQFIPEFVGTLKYTAPIGHLQLGGVYRDIAYLDTLTLEKESASGWGISASGNIKLTKKISLMSQYIYGKGIAKFIQDISGRGMDLVPENNNSGKLEAIECWGIYGALQFDFTKNLSSNLMFSYTEVLKLEQLPMDEYSDGYYLAANIFWEITPNFTLGAEYLWGERLNKNKAKGTAQRANVMAQFDF
jgi:DcaP outer membrane protein